MKQKHHYNRLTLRKDLNLFQAILAGTGIIVGAGIFVLLSPAAGLAGNAVWISFVVSALLAMLTGLSYAELSSIFSNCFFRISFIFIFVLTYSNTLFI